MEETDVNNLAGIAANSYYVSNIAVAPETV